MIYYFQPFSKRSFFIFFKFHNYINKGLNSLNTFLCDKKRSDDLDYSTTIMEDKCAKLILLLNIFVVVRCQSQYKAFENITDCKETGLFFQYYQTSSLKCLTCPENSTSMTVSSDGKIMPKQDMFIITNAEMALFTP